MSSPPPPPDLSALPPDTVVLVATLTLLQVLERLHRARIGPLSPSYRRLPFRDRFDWDRRALNLLFQLAQAPFNLYLLLLDPRPTADVIYGYSRVAHLGFLVVLAFYLYDAIGLVMHPAPPSNAPLWLFHHAVAAGLLLWDVAYRRSSAFPAAAFLLSAAAHIPNELRWLCTAMNVADQRLLKAVHLLSVLLAFLTCALPPPFLLFKCAQQLQISVRHLLTTRMRPQCSFVFALVYVPHIVLIFYQACRAYKAWGMPPRPYRPKKVD